MAETLEQTASEPPLTRPTRPFPFARAIAVLMCLFVLAAGVALIPYAGIQNDEALFGAGIYEPIGVAHSVRIFGKTIPTMLMPYLGGLKIWLYSAIFAVWEPSAWSLRLPVVLLGAATLWLAYLLFRRLLGTRGAVFGTVLLGTDATFIVTSAYDWGPVVLQHLMATGGAFAAVRFHDTRRTPWLAAAFFAFGLGMWDKALFAWILSGVAIAALVTVPRLLWSHFTRRNLLIASAAFCLGAAPLLQYNLARPMGTFRGTTRFSTENLNGKAWVLRMCFEGNSLFGYIVSDKPGDPPGKPQTALESASSTLAGMTGERYASYGFVALLAGIVLLPFAGRFRRAGLFALIACVVAWAQMALTKDTGGGAHHVVLLWPFPQLLMAASFTGAAERLRDAGRIALAAALAFFAVSNLLVLNQHFVLFVRGGTAPIWTDAIFALNDELRRQPARTAYVMDWGMFDALRLMHRGQPALAIGSDPFLTDAPGAYEKSALSRMFADREAVFVGHTPDKTVFASVPPRLEAALGAAGLRKQVVKVVSDRMRRPVFEIYRLAPAAQPAPPAPRS